MRISRWKKWRIISLPLCLIMLDCIIKLVALQAAPSIYLNEEVACFMAVLSTI